MDPVIGAALISGGSSLLGNLLGGIGESLEKKEERKWQEQQMQKQRGWKLEDRAAWEQKMKPKVPYYQTRNLPGMDYVLAKAVLGNLESRAGTDLMSKWGIDPKELLRSMNLDKPFGETSAAKDFYGELYPGQGVPGSAPEPPVPGMGRFGGRKAPGAFGGGRQGVPGMGMLARRYGIPEEPGYDRERRGLMA